MVDEEIVQFHGINVYDHRIAAKPFIVVRRDDVRLMLYRIEDLQISLGSLINVLAESGISFAVQNRAINVTREKAVGNLYRAFSRNLVPTAAMMDYYYGGKYFHHFYDQRGGMGI